MLSNELEFCLNDAFHQAREARHEYLTVEHLLLAILDTPKVREVLRGCGADLAKLKQELKQPHRAIHPEARRRRGARSAADAGLPARAAAGGVPRAVERQERSRRRQCAGRDLQREAEPRGVPAQPRARHAARRGQLHLARAARSAEDKTDKDKDEAAGDGERDGEARQRAGEVRHQPQPPGAGRAHRSADRPQARSRAHHRDPVPPPQEQSALRRRGRRRQDRDRRRAGAPHRRGQGAGGALRLHASSRSTWAR